MFTLNLDYSWLRKRQQTIGVDDMDFWRMNSLSFSSGSYYGFGEKRRPQRKYKLEPHNIMKKILGSLGQSRI